MVSILTLDEAKQFLRLRDDDMDRDDMLTAFLEGLTDVVEDQVGWVAPREIVVEFDQCNAYTAPLLSGNVISLTSGAEINGGAAVDVTGMFVDVNGILRNTTNTALSRNPWRLTLQVGMNPIPEAIKRGAAEILHLAWKTQWQIPGTDEDSAPAFLIPYRAQAWLSRYSNGPSVG